jgi:DNA polymerase I-like protein with 3'-5' exonuclease and polymerase domains
MKKVTKTERAHVLELPMTVTEWGVQKPALRWNQSDWKPTPLPELRPDEPVGLDFEYDVGEHDDPTKTRPISFSVYSPQRRQGWHCPWAYLGGGNLPEENCHRWFSEQLRNRDVYGLNVKAEMHAAYNWGHDPEAMGMRPHDVAFPPTLLREERVSGFSLRALAEEYLPPDDRKMYPPVPSEHLSLLHAGLAETYCIADSYLAWRIHEVTRPLIEKEDLGRVNELEDRCILPTVDAERNGARIDRAKLERWITQVDQQIDRDSRTLGARVGVSSFNPDSPEHLERLLYSKGRSQRPRFFDDKKKQVVQSWCAEALEPLAKEDPDWDLALSIREHKSIKSKYLDKYLAAIDSNDVLRFTLHQLRGQKDENDPRTKGTATGRFSCGGGKYNINIQQVMKAEKQLEDTRVKDYIIRELFISDEGMMMGASDASQIEFRIFSHAAACLGFWDTARAYQADPWVDFHLMATKIMKPNITCERGWPKGCTCPDCKELKRWRKHIKHQNFGILYGLGLEKLARKLGLGCTCPVNWMEKRWDDRRGQEVNVRYFNDVEEHETACLARQAIPIMADYQKHFPEAKKTTKACIDRAKDRGFVRTLGGRVRHLQESTRIYTQAFSSWDQGSAADYFKTKARELWEARRRLGIKIRMYVHDEFAYDTPGPNPELEKLLNTQSWNLHVPLLWETGYGRNWREANGQ